MDQIRLGRLLGHDGTDIRCGPGRTALAVERGDDLG